MLRRRAVAPVKVEPLSPVAVATARRVLADAHVRDARDIHVEAIAARNGGMILEGPSRTSRGDTGRARSPWTAARHVSATERRGLATRGDAPDDAACAHPFTTLDFIGETA